MFLRGCGRVVTVIEKGEDVWSSPFSERVASLVYFLTELSIQT